MNTSALLNTFPVAIQAAIGQYTEASHLTPEMVVEVALAHFLELDARSLTEASLETAINHYGAEAEMLPAFVVELAIAHFLDPDSVTFDDCQVGVQREEGLERLRRYCAARQITAA